MKISPVANPGAIQQPNSTPEHVIKAKAIAAFNKGQSSYDKPATHSQPPTQVVQNQSNVGVEELGAVMQKSNNPISEDVIEPSIQEPQIPTPDVDTTQKLETTPEDPNLSRQFAQLSRQERALRAKAQQQEQNYKAKEAAILAREEAIKAKEEEYRTGYVSRAKLKSNPLQTLAEAEISYDELTQQMLEVPGQTDPRMLAMISKLESKIQELETKNTKSEETYKSTQQQAYDSAIKQIRVDVDNLVKSDPNYEIIKATKSSKDVVDLIVRTYNEDGILMSVEDAANEVEKHIEEEALKLARLSKVTKRLQTVAPSQTPKPQQTQTQPKVQTQPPQMRTLTNAAASTRQLTAKERAILAFKGELK